MDAPLALVLPLLAILVLTLLVTGPGLWSEEWGWWWVRKTPARRRGPAGEDRDGRGEGDAVTGRRRTPP